MTTSFLNLASPSSCLSPCNASAQSQHQGCTKGAPFFVPRRPTRGSVMDELSSIVPVNVVQCENFRWTATRPRFPAKQPYFFLAPFSARLQSQDVPSHPPYSLRQWPVAGPLRPCAAQGEMKVTSCQVSLMNLKWPLPDGKDKELPPDVGIRRQAPRAVQARNCQRCTLQQQSQARQVRAALMVLTLHDQHPALWRFYPARLSPPVGVADRWHCADLHAVGGHAEFWCSDDAGTTGARLG